MSIDESSQRHETPGEVVRSHEVVEGNAAPAGPAMTGRSERTEVRAASPLAMWVNIIYFVFAIIDGLIAIRFVLKLLAANPQAGFSSFIYGITSPLLAPFTGLLGNPSASNGSQLEITSLVAFLVYALIGWLLTRLVVTFMNRSVSTARRDVM